MDTEIESLVVLGAGSMGHGITEVAAIAGYDVVMYDIEEDIVQEGYERIEWSVGKFAEKGQIDDSEAILDRISTTTNLGSAVAGTDLVVEAAPENLDLKQEIFSDIEAAASTEAIVATNTSSLRVSDIAVAVDQPERCCGLHFFNPPVKMDLVEVVAGETTREVVTDTAYKFVESIDKTPVHVRKDIPSSSLTTS